MTTATTSKPARRTLHYDSMAEILQDAEKLATAPVVMVGGWSFGQVMEHLAASIDYSIDGFPNALPAPVRFLMTLLMKRRFLTKPLPSGFKTPAGDPRLSPPSMETEKGLENLRRAIERFQGSEQFAMHPVLNQLTKAEWEQFHCRHAELHMSFATPGEA